MGPRIGGCCYEVDAPVFDALRQRFGADLDGAVEPTRPGRGRLDLGVLVRLDLAGHGIAEATIDLLPDVCTHCDADRFHSYRRDGAAAGRLVHYIAAAGEPPR